MSATTSHDDDLDVSFEPLVVDATTTDTATSHTAAPARVATTDGGKVSSNSVGSARVISDDGSSGSELGQDDAADFTAATNDSQFLPSSSTTSPKGAMCPQPVDCDFPPAPRVVQAIPIFQDPNLAIQAQHERQQQRSASKPNPFAPLTNDSLVSATTSERGGEEDSVGAADGSFFWSDNRSTPRHDIETTGLGTGVGLLTRGAGGTAVRRLPDGTTQDARAQGKQQRPLRPIAAIDGPVDDEDYSGLADFQVGVPMQRQNSSSISTVATFHDIMQGEVLEDPLLAEFRRVPEPERRNIKWMNLETFSRGHAVAFATDPEGSRGLQAMITDALGSIWSFFAKHRPATVVDNKTKKTTLSELASLGAATPQLRGSDRDEVLQQLNDIFQQLLPYILDLSEDPFANYVVQKYLETQSAMYINPMVQRLKGHCFRMTMNGFACRVLQNIVDACASGDDTPGKHMTNTVVEFLRELDEADHLYRCVLDQNGNHVVQRCIMTFPNDVGFIATRLRERFLELAQHVYGSRVIQCVFEEVRAPLVDRESEQGSLRLMVLAFRNIKLLINTQFGNFVVGHALLNSPPNDKAAGYPGRVPADPETVDGAVDRLAVRECLVAATLCRATMYSRSKYSSNVVQRAIECASHRTLTELTNCLLQHTQIPPASLGRDSFNRNNRTKNTPDFRGFPADFMSMIPEVGAMMMDPYANYVVGTLFQVVPPEVKERIFHEIQPYIPAIVRTHAGKHLIQKIAPQLVPTNQAPPPFPGQSHQQQASQQQPSLRVGGPPPVRVGAAPAYHAPTGQRAPNQRQSQQDLQYASGQGRNPQSFDSGRSVGPPAAVGQQQPATFNERRRTSNPTHGYHHQHQPDQGREGSQQLNNSGSSHNASPAPSATMSGMAPNYSSADAALLAQNQQLMQQQLMLQQMLIQQQQAALAAGWGTGMGGWNGGMNMLGGFNSMGMGGLNGMANMSGLGGMNAMGGLGVMGGFGALGGYGMNPLASGAGFGLGGLGGLDSNTSPSLTSDGAPIVVDPLPSFHGWAPEGEASGDHQSVGSANSGSAPASRENDPNSLFAVQQGVIGSNAQTPKHTHGSFNVMGLSASAGMNPYAQQSLASLTMGQPPSKASPAQPSALH